MNNIIKTSFSLLLLCALSSYTFANEGGVVGVVYPGVDKTAGDGYLIRKTQQSEPVDVIFLDAQSSN